MVTFLCYRTFGEKMLKIMVMSIADLHVSSTMVGTIHIENFKLVTFGRQKPIKLFKITSHMQE